MSASRRLPYVEDVTIFGNALHLLVRGVEDNATVARDLERSSGARVEVRAIAPSLEDVFVRITRLQQEAAVAANGGAR